MFKSLTVRALLASTVLAMVAIAPATVSAREGSARSVGKGVKCRTAAVTQANGTVTYQQVCYKGV